MGITCVLRAEKTAGGAKRFTANTVGGTQCSGVDVHICIMSVTGNRQIPSESSGIGLAATLPVAAPGGAGAMGSP